MTGLGSRERAVVRDLVARARLQVADDTIEQDADVRRAYAWANEVLDRYAPKGRIGKCVYCGSPATKQLFPRTCPAHEDIPAVDPAFRDELKLRGVA